MPDAAKTTYKHRRKQGLFGTLGIVLALALWFGGWVYKAKTQRNLNMQLLGAVRNDDAETARLLLAQGADPNIHDVPEEQLSLWQQIRHAFHKDSQSPNDPPETVLEMAMSLGGNDADTVNVALIKTLLEAGARPNDCSGDHITPMMVAVQFDSPQAVQMLLDHGANPLAKDDFGRLPIHCLYFDDPDALKIAEMLVKRGEDINATNDSGRTALLQSSILGNIHMLRFFIAHGAKIDVVDNDDNTPLIDCLRSTLFSERTDIVKFLIAHGADVNHCNKVGETALSLAKSLKYKQSIRLLEAAGAKQ